ncbi:hypothetical protein MVEN_00837800 [Mycena venus]|uniref:F-box domain-containing protein n=1 Tax=Mycena venus TaxID=2733690 RepID=A0A8H6YF97_9AGAR|nr:hypothetical protein MVEN_00837800 [Mycena venus]
MSPIRRLPLDILEQIFVACLPTHRNCVMSAQEAPVILGRICSSWRTISLATPRLWSRLHIVEPTGLESPNSLNTLRRLQRLEVANSWLRRSGECPLSISLNPSPDPLIPGPPPMSPSGSHANSALFLTALIQFASRWQNIRLVGKLSALEALSRLTEHEVPLLKRLEIVCFEDTSATDAQWRLSQFGVFHGPSLSAISFAASNTEASELPLRWNQLRVLSLTSPPWDGEHVQTCGVVLEILSRCPNLQICSILVDAGDGPPEEDPMGSIVECLFLHTLDLTSSLMEFLCGLSPSVQNLHITDPKQMPWQPYLEIALDDTVLATLASRRPTLQELVILDCYNVSDEGLLAFIVSRPSALRRIEVKFNREKQVDILPSLQSFATDCLESSITYKSIPTPPSHLSSPWEGLPDAPNRPPSWQPWPVQTY